MLNQVGISDLRDVSKERMLYIFGAGRIMQGVLKSYARFGLEVSVRGIIDNNESLWDTSVQVNDTTLKICSLQQALEKICEKPAAIAVFVKDNETIEKQLQDNCAGRDIMLYSYPTCICINEEKWKQKYSKADLENRIVMQGEGDSRENALAIFEYLKEHNLFGKYKVAWICNHPEQFKSDENVEFIKRDLMLKDPTPKEVEQYIKVLYTSRYLFYENMLIYKIRDDQISAYLKHGTFPLKNVKGILKIAEDVDKVICTSENYAEHAVDMEEGSTMENLLICGSPRLDFLYKEKHVMKTLDKYTPDKKYIIWLPTLRQTVGRNDMAKISPLGIPLIKSHEEFSRIDNALGKMNCKLVIKPHPHQDLSVYKIDDYENIIFIPQSDLDAHDFTIHSLMRECDGLISDYSSIAFDYMLLDRPIAYTVDDMDEYKIGFSVPDPFHFMPGEKLENVDNMISFVEHVIDRKDLFKEERHEIRDYIHKYQDDKNSERFLNMMGMI